MRGRLVPVERTLLDAQVQRRRFSVRALNAVRAGLPFGSVSAYAEPAPDISSTAGSSRQVRAVGISESRICGVRDHAVSLANELTRSGTQCDLHWLWRRQVTLGGARDEVRRWTRQLSDELRDNQTDALLLHYSVFAYSFRGLPIFVRPILAALRSLEIPVITVLHELAYPWMRRGVRGTVWAVSQRAALMDVIRTSAGVIVTTPSRADWLRTARYLSKRPIAVAPVFPNLPPPNSYAPRHGTAPVIGLFGYASEGVMRDVVLDAMRLLDSQVAGVELALLGAPAATSDPAQAWLAAARALNVAQAITFSGILPAQQLSDAIAACDILLFADSGGPSGRKTTLAASLASGRPVVALDGSDTWRALVASNAIRVVEPSASSVACAVRALLDDRRLQADLAARGVAFANRHMSVAHAAEVTAGLIAEVIGEASR